MGFRVRPEAMRQVVGGIGALLVHAVRTAVDVGSTTLDARGFGAFGAAVGAAQQDLQSNHVDALDGLLAGLQRVNRDVRRVADAYEQIDHEVATGFGGVRDGLGGATGGLLAGLWGSGVGPAVAGYARDHAGAGEPASVDNVVGYLRDGGVGRVADAPLPSDRFAGPTSFADWLDSDPANQTHVGVIHVYRGDVRDLADIPGGVRAGDVVVIDPDVIGVATAAAAPGAAVPLANHGPLDTDLGHRTSVRVYRPL